ncbi:hypothetical protein M407DRAFT_158505 [Tulasnella calospora MUT 4182]|uniref:Uncharacterized protein n=1 Tax=Tulasnella calospora MUT 4182 TaxID=1051891 RepID=A0A0C3QR27_9AGAM|nr:hypothetical protein M407DRAFT_158505 [Tulasnella calospora MUT 4182]
MAPTLLTARAKSQDSGNGLSITSAAVKKGRPTVVKYSWQYHDKSPKFFAVGVVDVSSNEYIHIQDDEETRNYGENGKGTDHVSISVLENRPGKYVLVLVDANDFNKVYATSKAFQVKKSDF